MNTPNRVTLRALAADAGVPVRDVIELLRVEGFTVGHPTQKLEGADLRRAREALGLRARPKTNDAPARRLNDDELCVQLLRPLRQKGKVGRNRTTPIENTWGRGIPDHQKDDAQATVERYLKEGLLEEKVSQGRRHVWVTSAGLATLEAAEASVG